MRSKRWRWWEILLWAYSTIYVLFLILVFILGATYPSSNSSNNNSGALIALIILTLPVIAFLALEGIKHLGEYETDKESEVGSDEITKLQRRRNKVLAWIFLCEVLLTLVEIPLLRNSPNLIHTISIWLDFVFDVPLIYFIIQMFRQKNVLKPLFYVALLDSILSVIFVFLLKNHDYNGIVITVLLTAFFAYYILSPLTKKNSKISYFILLPIFVAYFLGSACYAAYQGAKATNSQGAVDNAVLNYLKGEPAEQTAFQTLVTEQDVNNLHQDVLNLQTVNNSQLQQAESLENMITAAEAKTTNQAELSYYGKLFAYVDELKSQELLTNELVTYDVSINYNEMTSEQAATNRNYINQITAMTADIIDKYQALEGEGFSGGNP